jgi:hypothetical protein
MEYFWTVWRISRQSKRFLDIMESFQKAWKIGFMHLNHMNPEFNSTQIAFTGRCTYTGMVL